MEDNIIALAIDNSNEFALLINEVEFDTKINTPEKVNSYREKKYLTSSSSPYDNSVSIPQSNREGQESFIKMYLQAFIAIILLLIFIPLVLILFGEFN